MNTGLPQHDIVLLGAGHTNAHVLRMWRMAPIRDARLTLVTNFYTATYSGMLPGTLAGLYPPERMQIDLVRLCASAGVRLLRARVIGLDHERRELLCDDRTPIPFDVLSVGIGSVPRGLEATQDPSIVPIKPMQTFLARFDARLQAAAASAIDRPLRLAVIGAGAGGVEIAFCVPERVRQICGEQELELLLVDGADRILPGMPAGTARAARRELERRGVRLLLGQGVREVRDGTLTLADESQHAVDLVLWSTGAQAPELLSRLGLPTDESGFLLTHATLQTVADQPIFAVGDSGTIEDRPTPKAGVYAVRQGPVLWGNLHRQLRGQPLLKYEPQKGFLSLLATGDRRAIHSYKGMTFHGGWCWRLKDYIDGRFMDMYQDYSTAPMAWPLLQENPNHQALAMRCAGCGGKVGGSVLSRVLERLEIPASEHVLLGLDSPDDAAVLRLADGQSLLASVDFFAAFLDDPYLVGRVAALNAASDLFAKNARPLAALAIATIPVGPERQQEQLLYDLLAGSLHEFRQMGTTLVGGHTIEGPQTTIGFSMLAQAHGPLRLKGNLREGDQLVLTKPLGSGVLLAAHMQARCRAEWLESLLPVLTTSNQAAAALADEFDIAAITDVTGFGLAGHLAEMLRASRISAEIHQNTIPLMPGVAELFAAGLESTLSPANRAIESEMDVDTAMRSLPQFAALFDPQTSGGLLLGVPEQHVEAVLKRLAEQTSLPAACIGRVTPASGEGPLIMML